MEETLLFVYGTLKRGQPNHGRLARARWLGEGLLEGVCLHDLGPFPMAIAGEGSLHGEIYAVAWSALADLDAFEGCPRLYRRCRYPLADGRLVWIYLGQPRQVRHVPRLPGGLWPALTQAPLVPFLFWLLHPLALPAGAFDTLAACQAWRSSRGLARIELANSIGEAHALTKRHAFQESSPEAPVALYSPSDIQRVCRLP